MSAQTICKDLGVLRVAPVDWARRESALRRRAVGCPKPLAPKNKNKSSSNSSDFGPDLRFVNCATRIGFAGHHELQDITGERETPRNELVHINIYIYINLREWILHAKLGCLSPLDLSLLLFDAQLQSNEIGSRR